MCLGKDQIRDNGVNKGINIICGMCHDTNTIFMSVMFTMGSGLYFDKHAQTASAVNTAHGGGVICAPDGARPLRVRIQKIT